jgi:hypothetical protein
MDVAAVNLRLGAFDLQPQVLRIEPRNHVADPHAVADIDDAARRSCR